jgi:hydroxymethylpyrimidine pyrophosphatase-like HAD family hydrolase
LTYEQELQALPDAYADILAWDGEELRKALLRLTAGPVAFVASGGMLAVSVLAAALHEQAAQEPATALTPLGAISRPSMTESGAVLFTSSGKHPDAVEVMRRLGRPGLRPAVVMTHRAVEDLPVEDATVITLPGLVLREGFLAVNSVLAMAAAMVRGYQPNVLPDTLAEADREPWQSDVDRLLVLHPPALSAVAADIEIRASEVGLAAVQTADYRNFAHGRHTGLARTLQRTTIIALTDPSSEALASATLSVLPDAAPVVRWHSSSPWPVCALELLVESMRACGELGNRQRVSLARPKVPVFGRRLYRLPIRKRLPDVLSGPVDRKLAAAGAGRSGDELRDVYTRVLDEWREELADVRFGGIVLDYDGTVCTTEGRFRPPRPAVAEALNRLLSEGLVVGFASGRGPSMHVDLRGIIDCAHWDRVHIGLYNGGHIVGLDEDLEDLRTPTQFIEQIDERLRQLPISSALDFQPRRVQLTVEPGEGAWVRPAALADAVSEMLAREPALPVKVVRSGHSLDIVSATTSKTAVLEKVSAASGAAVLTVGDQGQIGGNDFELLAADHWSISVDRCSADPTRCWYLGDGSLSGPHLLVRCLKALVSRKDGHALRVGAI